MSVIHTIKAQCLVCGNPDVETIGGSLSDEICECCGVQYGLKGYDIYDRTYEQARADWIAGGMKWWQSRYPPADDWSPNEQLKAAGYA